MPAALDNAFSHHLATVLSAYRDGKCLEGKARLLPQYPGLSTAPGNGNCSIHICSTKLLTRDSSSPALSPSSALIHFRHGSASAKSRFFSKNTTSLRSHSLHMVGSEGLSRLPHWLLDHDLELPCKRPCSWDSRHSGPPPRLRAGSVSFPLQFCHHHRRL